MLTWPPGPISRECNISTGKLAQSQRPSPTKERFEDAFSDRYCSCPGMEDADGVSEKHVLRHFCSFVSLEGLVAGLVIICVWIAPIYPIYVGYDAIKDNTKFTRPNNQIFRSTYKVPGIQSKFALCLIF